MMIGGKLKEYAPFFDKENEDFEIYQTLDNYTPEVQMYFLDREEVTYFEPWESPQFSLDAYFDLLVAPGYVFQKIMDVGFGYPAGLVGHFFVLFPTNDVYQKQLKTRLDDVKIAIRNLKESSDYRSEILTSYRNVQEKLKNIRECLVTIAFNDENQDYLITTLSIIDEIHELIINAIQFIVLTPDDIIKYNYFAKNHHISWVGNPLAYFINVVYGDGKDLEEREWQQEENSEIYQSKRLQRQAHISSGRFLEKNEKTKNIQSQIDELCSDLNSLYETSVHQSWEKKCLSAYATIIINVQAKFRKDIYNYTNTFPVGKPYYTKITDKKFLNSLIKSSIIDVDGVAQRLFNPPITPDELKFLMLGDYSSLPKLRTEWESGAFYYFLIKSILEGAYIKSKSLEDAKKLFMKDGRLFRETSFRKHLSQELNIKLTDVYNGNLLLDPHKKTNLYYKKIDNLFR